MKYNKLTPFKWCIINNFPFIEADFDAITNYQLFQKVVEYLNKTIDTTNTLGLEVERFSNYFDNLNVQDEINKKLDTMAESGELQEIITQYLKTNGILAFNTVSDMINSENLINGSFAKTYGKNTLNDGFGSFYKIRNITNEDVVDGENIIKLINSNILIAEKIINENNNVLFVGDSYTEGYSPDGNIPNGQRFWELFAKMQNINNYYSIYEGGCGFSAINGNNHNFKTLIRDKLNTINVNNISKIFIFGGYNDYNKSTSELNTSIKECVEYIKDIFPNLQNIYIGMIGFNSKLIGNSSEIRYNLFNNVLPAYSNSLNYNDNFAPIYLENVEYALHNKNLMASDGYHPNIEGHKYLANAIFSAYNNGYDFKDTAGYISELTNDSLSSKTVNIFVNRIGKNMHIKNNQISLTYNNNQSFPCNQFTDLGLLETSKIIPTYDTIINCNAIFRTDVNYYYCLPCLLKIGANGHLLINPLKLASSGTAWSTLTDINYVEIFQFDSLLPLTII